MTEQTLIQQAIKAVKADAKKTEYERGYYNGLVAGEYLQSEDASLEGLAELKGVITEPSAETKEGDEKQGRIQELAQELEQVQKIAESTGDELSKVVAEFAEYKLNSISMESHQQMLSDMGQTIAKKDAEMQQLRETASIALRAPTAPGKYSVRFDADNKERPYAVITNDGRAISRHASENDALVAAKTAG